MLGACTASGVRAQEIPAGDGAISVQKRPRPELDPVPVRFGGFEVLPSAELRTAYDDNIYAANTNKVDDALVTLSGGIAARSTWRRHALSFNATTGLTRGLSQDDENTNTYDLQASGQLDIGAGTQASLRAGYSRAYEPRGSVGDTTLRGPRIAYNTLELGVQLEHNVGRLLLGADASFDTFRYGTYRVAGAEIAQGNRDYRTWSTSLRAGYAIGPGIATFVEGSYNKARYPDETTLLDRSSDGYSVRGGVQFGVTRLIRGTAAIGYQNQRYDDPAFPRIKGLDFAGSLEWNPTKLMTWTVEAKRTIQRSPLVGVAGIRQSRYSGKLDYELRRNVILTTRLDQTVSDYAGTQRIQRDLAGSLGAEWLLNRNLRVSAQGGFQRTRSDGTGGRKFDRKRASVSLKYAL
ncbi:MULTISPECIES: outer membrane beta-barrel protein [unclassified Novosphingobium]|uniref:outer membrane beta-barrel protein n=1 Tax=unclassified Novosphingobium TaxID=2644732 RepID=UPI00135BA21F|nr:MULTISPECIES: outer membrane beta-barrel protein [unclassified Novosphingobium]